MGKIMLNEISYSGGGGGNADIVRLTQAEYDALPSSKLTDDKVYMITDVNGNGSQFQPVIYSENEREIGVWTDGKPLYQKTVNITSFPNNQLINIPHNISNIDNVVYVAGTAHIKTSIDANNIFVNFPRVQDTDATANMAVDINNTYVSLKGRQSDFAYLFDYGYVTIQYTKTTDTAGSGQWTPQGVPAVHYSTDEQVIGTWIDGSTLYEKTIILSTPLSMNAYSWGTVSTLTEQINIVSAEGIYNTGTEYAFYPIGANCDTNKELIILNYRNVQNSINIIILRYTKTTS